ncbi:hypothetical protein TTHERM_01119510 (macronuclear) [Tetrahymena thermophila SB210]|uniref:Uncharacterized protein n=1 Tax=Tetrahymena thermophila (strain SB210) TaxID=312017 RepID=Q239M9_TETTS|nr:hypothetical protein TTHERM_01119510 [Tetrahymena thermophila SB210]EAR93241.1 hypothetical protein TTHERM_01119510 [Tetrahymena thermophila SB210]|eukprot:XP_001013486.1 hypothetical protein TTHERM_01119510 [Tetrahymena thermophila SB210]
MKNFDDLNNDKSLFLTQSYLRKGGLYQKQLQYQQQMEQENRIAREQLEQQKKYIEEKEQIELDVSRPIQMNDELIYLAQTIKNSDSADKNSGINNLINNRKIAKSFSIISPKPQTHSDLQVNIQINGEASIKSQYPNSNIDLDLDKKKVNTEIQLADQDDNLIDTNRLLDLQINNMDKSKHANGNCSVQTAYFKDKNSMSINHNQPSSFFPNTNNRLEVGQINQISRFGLSQNNINLVKSEIDDYEDCDDTIDETGEFTKAEVTKYQFRTREPQLRMKKEQIFNKPSHKGSYNAASFCNNHINQTFASNRNGSCEQLPNSSRRRFLSNHQGGAISGQNLQQQNQSKEFSYDLTSSRAKQNNNKDQNNSQLVPYSFMQSHGIQDTSHNSTSDVLSQQQQIDNITQNLIDKHIPSSKENILYNQQQDYLIILSNASIESDSHSPQQTQRDDKKQLPQTFLPILEENILETNRSTLNSFNKIEKKINETQLINSFHLKNKNGIPNKTKSEFNNNNKNHFKHNEFHKNTFTMTEEFDETFEKEKITKHQFEVLSPNLSLKSKQIFNPSSKKGSTNSSFSINNNNNNCNYVNFVDHSNHQIQLFSPKNSDGNLKSVSSCYNPTQNILQYTYTKDQIDKLITQQSKSKYKGQQSEQQQQQQVLTFSTKQSHETTNYPSASTNFISKTPQILNYPQQQPQQQQQQIQQPSLKNLQIQNQKKNNKIE